MILEATPDNLEGMLELSKRKRAEYERYQPRFWRPAPDARENQRSYFKALLSQETTLALVAKEGGELKGFILAALLPAPPVYDPGGLTCLIDDFAVNRPEDWPTVGRALLDAARKRAKARGAVQCVVVCGHLDGAKRAMLRAAGTSIASEWWVGSL